MFAMSFIFVNFIIAESGVGMWAMVLSEGNRSARAGRQAPQKRPLSVNRKEVFFGGAWEGLTGLCALSPERLLLVWE